jgi:hypothetical protein
MARMVSGFRALEPTLEQSRSLEEAGACLPKKFQTLGAGGPTLSNLATSLLRSELSLTATKLARLPDSAVMLARAASARVPPPPPSPPPPPPPPPPAMRALTRLLKAFARAMSSSLRLGVAPGVSASCLFGERLPPASDGFIAPLDDPLEQRVSPLLSVSLSVSLSLSLARLLMAYPECDLSLAVSLPCTSFSPPRLLVPRFLP